MDQLPQELLDAILIHLAPVDCCEYKVGLSSLRSSCKRLAAAAAPYLFSTIPVWISEESLGKLIEASNHTIISQYVREIRFSPLQICPPKAWIDPTEQVQADFNPRSEATEGFVHATHHSAITEDYLNSQTQLYILNEGALHLSQALKRLPHVDSIDLPLFSHKIGGAELSRKYVSLTHEEYVWKCEPAVKLLVQALKNVNQRIQSLRCSDDEIMYYHGYDLRLIQGRPRRLQSSSDQHDETVSLPGLLAELDCTSLERLVMRINPNGRFVSGEAAFQTFNTSLQKLVDGAPNLTSLELGCGSNPRFDVRGSELMENIRIPTLRRLHLCFMIILRTGLFTFFCHHTASLQEVLVEGVKLRDSRGWQDFVQILRCLDFKILDSFTISHCDLARMELVINVAPFLTRHTDEDPFASLDLKSDDDDDQSWTTQSDPPQHPLDFLPFGESDTGSEYHTPDGWSSEDDVDEDSESESGADERNTSVNRTSGAMEMAVLL